MQIISGKLPSICASRFLFRDEANGNITIDTLRVGKRKSVAREQKSKRILLCVYTLSLELSWHRTIGMRCGPMPKTNETAAVLSSSDSNKRLALVLRNKNQKHFCRVLSLCNGFRCRLNSEQCSACSRHQFNI